MNINNPEINTMHLKFIDFVVIAQCWLPKVMTMLGLFNFSFLLGS